MRLNEILNEAPNSYVTTIRIDLICRPEKPYPEQVEKLRNAYKAGAQLPLIEVIELSEHNREALLCGPNTTYMCVNGHHRLAMYESEGVHEVKAKVWDDADDLGDWLGENQNL